MTIHEIETIHRATGLSVTEFTSLLPVHRTTYYGWLRGDRAPDPLRLRLCAARCAKLLALVDAKLLPLGVDVPKEHRMLRVEGLLKRQITNS